MTRALILRRLAVAIPIVVFVALVALFYLRLGAGDPSRLPSALIGKPAPALVLPPLEAVALPGLNPAEFATHVALINVWASWCGPCREEHRFLARLAADRRIRLVGINYKDAPDNARRFLDRYGNPYAAIGVDTGGRAAIEWGVYGVPETFLVGRDGKIAYKHVGPITDETLPAVLSAIDRAFAAGS
jgi:cytochrome c biogenesis protein CcmG, thiol:disulfide interchange protein DsbE